MNSLDNKKKFIITIDTEGDNLWSWNYGDNITSRNAKFLPRFQELCDEFGFKPVYLTNYEMAMDTDFVSMASEALNRGACEIGMHLHAVNNPPIVNNPAVAYPNNFPYLIEYQEKIIEEKIAYITKLLEDKFERKMVTHRAGRWALNKTYENLLIKYGYKIDCSVTPGINWSSAKGISEGSKGSDYSHSPNKPYYLDDDKNLLEIPVTIRHYRKGFLKSYKIIEILKYVKHIIYGQDFWLRPTGNNLDQLLYLLDEEYKSNESDYIMFMLHSSEFMPGGSPTFPNNESIEKLYEHMRILFEVATQYYRGVTLQEYYNYKFNNSKE